ncbi:X-X-X-Leu-X-X-Gly heptad repeats [Agathobacter rectalis]|uniref:X-X-X-Leu-X-X-Gly heptad repeats n=1 Tax=Agathobacter rectalis TaxID=39491 RepID=UPI0001CD3E1D|nr:X-X-X-Leu-X-X-Gly heptad repeats [Agathobacter rectalis]CBK89907.1 X-X-X-Leu-X-X-Gly heptad repeats [Agathobacter rectalis DSM 17629]
MKLPELKEKLKSKYIVRVVAGVLTIALVGTGIGATAVFAEKNSTAVTAEADSTTGSSKDADDIADKLMDSVSLKDNDADKDESVYLISDANGNVNKTIVVDHLKNKDKKDTLEDASNLSDIENVKGKEKFTQSGDKLTWQAGGKDIYYQGTATEEPPVTQKVTYYLDGKEISPEDLAGKSGKVKIRFDYTNTTSYTETVNGEKQTVSVPFAAITGLVLGDGFENIEVTNGKAEVSDSSSVVLGYALPGLKNSLGIKDKDLDGDVNIPEYMEMTADVKNFSMPAAMTFVVNASDYVSTDGIDTSDLDDMINDLKDASTQLQDGSKTLAEGTDTLTDGLSTLQSKLGTFASGVGTLQSGLKTYTDGVSTLSGGLNKLNSNVPTLSNGITTLNSSAKSLNDGVALLNATVSAKFTDSEKKTLLDQVHSTLESQKSEIEKQAQTTVASQKTAIQKQAQSTVADQKEDIEKKAQAAVDDQKEQIKSVAAETVKQQETEIKNQAASAVEQEFTSGKTDYITNEAKKQLASIKPVIESGVKAQFVQKMAEKNPAITDYDSAKTFFDQNVGMKDGAAEACVNEQIDTIINNLAGSVASTAKDASKIAAGEAAYTAASQTAGEAAYTGASLAAGTAAYTAARQTAGEAAYAGASLAATTAAYTGAVSGAEQATITSAEQTKATVAASINQKQANGYSLVTGMKALADGTQTLYNSVPTLTSGIKQLVDGSNTLVANNAQLNSGASQLADGTNQIVSGVDQLTTGSHTLSEGAHTLADGMVQFNEEGINKILDAYNGDLKPFTDKLQAVIDAGEEYQTYSAIADGQTGSVKFIYKLASIDAKADSDK